MKGRQMSVELLYVGCYTPDSGEGDGEGIIAVRRDPRTGQLTMRGLVAATPSPSFLARHPTLPVLYAVNELPEGAVSAWALGTDGSVATLGSRPTGGGHPCHLAVTPDGGYVVSANYASGSVAVHPLDATGAPGERTGLAVHEGSGPVADRQEAAHAHMVRPEGSTVLAVDLGADRVFRHRIGAGGELTEAAPAVEMPAGTGPRHLTRHPDGRYYLASELEPTVTVFGPDFDERYRVATTARPVRAEPAEIAIAPDGRFLYVANRGPNTITVFEITAGAPGFLAEVPAGGVWPRHFAIVGEHLYVANERSHNVAVFRLDPDTGVPEQTGSLEAPSPTCVLPGN
jgi:6-phosphogluconolactonase (cycloisomerase 2 family)